MQPRTRLLIFAGLGVLAVLTYLPALNQPFISDDYGNILLARMYGPAHAWKSLAAEPVQKYRPIFMVLTYWIHQFFGPWPPGYILVSIALHVVNTWLVFALGAWPAIGWRVSALSAMFFAVYEGHQEAVMWYSAAYELLLLFFGLVCFVLWVRWLQGPRRPAWLYAGALAAFVLALLSKESAIALVPLLLLPVAIQQAGRRRGFFGLIPFFVLALLFCLWVFAGVRHSPRLEDGSFSFHVATPRHMLRVAGPPVVYKLRVFELNAGAADNARLPQLAECARYSSLPEPQPDQKFYGWLDPSGGKKLKNEDFASLSVVQIGADGKQSIAATLPSILNGQEASGGNRLALLNGVVYATSGAWLEAAGARRMPNTAAIVKVEGGKATEVANTWDLENGQNPGGYVKEAHPYGLAAGPDGKLWVADAGANDLLRVDPTSGQVELVATFSGMPGPLPNPNRGGAQESDAVPTGMAFDASGNAYVSFLPGFPFAPGSAKVVKVAADGKVSDYATGLTMLTDLRTGPDGALYAVQIAQFTDKGPVPNSGAILRVKPGGTSEVVVSDLSFPTSIAFNAAGDAYVTTNGMGAPGSGEVLQFAKLTSQAGTALPPATLPTTGGGEPAHSVGGWIAGSLALGLGLLAAGFALRRRSVA